MSGDVRTQFYEGLGVKIPGATHPRRGARIPTFRWGASSRRVLPHPGNTNPAGWHLRARAMTLAIPWVLPGGDAVLFVVFKTSERWEDADIVFE